VSRRTLARFALGLWSGLMLAAPLLLFPHSLVEQIVPVMLAGCALGGVLLVGQWLWERSRGGR
jgi:hypothetical protein